MLLLPLFIAVDQLSDQIRYNILLRTSAIEIPSRRPGICLPVSRRSLLVELENGKMFCADEFKFVGISFLRRY
jgi:hypothetical protein